MSAHTKKRIPQRAGSAPAVPESIDSSLQAWFPLLIVLVGMLAYANSFRGAFVLDDWDSFLNKGRPETLEALWQVIRQSTRPLTQFTLEVNYALGGWDVRGYHAFNLFVHLSGA